MALSVIRYVLQSLISFFQRSMSFLTFASGPVTVDMNDMTINVRFSADLTIALQVNRDCTVKTMKERLASRLDVPIEELRVIFSGKELHDDASFKVTSVET